MLRGRFASLEKCTTVLQNIVEQCLLEDSCLLEDLCLLEGSCLLEDLNLLEDLSVARPPGPGRARAGPGPGLGRAWAGPGPDSVVQMLCNTVVQFSKVANHPLA